MHFIQPCRRPILFNCLDEQLIWTQFKRAAGKTDQNLYACDVGADACVTALKELHPPHRLAPLHMGGPIIPFPRERKDKTWRSHSP